MGGLCGGPTHGFMRSRSGALRPAARDRVLRHRRSVVALPCESSCVGARREASCADPRCRPPRGIARVATGPPRRSSHRRTGRSSPRPPHPHRAPDRDATTVAPGTAPSSGWGRRSSHRLPPACSSQGRGTRGAASPRATRALSAGSPDGRGSDRDRAASQRRRACAVQDGGGTDEGRPKSVGSQSTGRSGASSGGRRPEGGLRRRSGRAG